MANLNRGDLDFVLQQVLISESDSAAQIAGNFDTLPVLVNRHLELQIRFFHAYYLLISKMVKMFRLVLVLTQTNRKEVQHPILKPVV